MKKIFVLISLIAVTAFACVSFSASADDGTVVIDNVVYELTTQKYGKYDYGEHYAVTDFFYDKALADTTTKINIVDEIDGIEVKVIYTNPPVTGGDSEPYPEYNYSFPTVKNIVIPGTVKYIGYYSFSFFPNVEKLYLPAELEGIGTGAFCLMKSLRSITIPQGVTYISDRTFYGCESLKKVKIAGDILGIGCSAFYNCQNLTSLNFPNSIKEFGEGAFDYTALKKIIIPENVKLHTDGGGITQGCSKLEKIVFEDTSSDKAKYLEFMCLDRTPSVKGLYIKTIPTKGLFFGVNDLDNLPNLEKIYFAGSEEKWNELTSETLREALEKRGIEVEFYYRHSHSFKQSGNVTCTKGGTYKYTCECGDSYSYKVAKDTEGHKFGAWKVTRKSTYTVAGEKQRKCSLCGKVEKKYIAVLKLQTVLNISCERTLNSITISWDPVEGANGYRVYWKDSPTGKYQKIASLKNKTTYTFKDLDKCSKYYFKIQPYHKDSKGNVAFANISRVFGVFTIATAPANLKAVSTEPGTVKLTWESSGDDSHYFVHYGTSKQEVIEDEEFLFIHVGKKESKTLKNLESGKTYYFKISITDETVDGIKISNIAEVTVK